MGIVQNQSQAQSIVGQLQNARFSNNDISVLFPNKQGTKDFAHEHSTKAPEGAVAGYLPVLAALTLSSPSLKRDGRQVGRVPLRRRRADDLQRLD
jgi:hypothetical protein